MSLAEPHDEFSLTAATDRFPQRLNFDSLPRSEPVEVKPCYDDRPLDLFRPLADQNGGRHRPPDSMASWPDPYSLTALPSGYRQFGPLPVPEPELEKVEEYRSDEPLVLFRPLSEGPPDSQRIGNSPPQIRTTVRICGQRHRRASRPAPIRRRGSRRSSTTSRARSPSGDDPPSDPDHVNRQLAAPARMQRGWRRCRRSVSPAGQWASVLSILGCGVIPGRSARATGSLPSGGFETCAAACLSAARG
jgi:hypothetical protein